MYELPADDYDLAEELAPAEDADGYNDWNYDSYEDMYVSSDERTPNLDLFGYFEGVSVLDITRDCVVPTVLLVCSTYIPTLIACLCFQKINTYMSNETYKHVLSGVLGIGMLYIHFQLMVFHSFGLVVISYLFIRYIWRQRFSTGSVIVLLLAYLTFCEFTFEGSSWSRVRNVHMLIVMKIISLMVDSDKKQLPRFPSFVHYFGYIFCVGNCIFGPWTDYASYLNIYKPKKWTISYLTSLLKSVVYSLFSFTLSMCYVDWLLQLEHEKSLITMYGKALEFRTGHYFIMFMSESLILAAGFEKPGKHHEIEHYLTRPSKIELPYSLVEVVVYWNVSMHKWLKNYVFKPLSKYGHFIAVIGTYNVSSLLHGLNYQLSAILLSLAFYTYVEHNLRRKLSRKFDACIGSKPCEQYCHVHKHTGRKLIVYFVNKIFTLVAVYHLGYLGYLIDLRSDNTSSFRDSFTRWQSHNFSSHVLAFFTFFICLFL